MIKLLTRLFIKDSGNVTDPNVRRAYGTLCSVFGIFLNLLLFCGKYLAGTLSGSVAIIADAFNNLSDAGSSIITLLGFVIASKKPDLDHPFGHGRAEYLAGLLLSSLILLMGLELGKSSFDKILNPVEIQAGLLPALILLMSIAVKAYMCLYNRATARKISSAAMEATAMDSLSDTIATTVVLIAMGVSWLFNINIDGYAGLVVALFIIYTGYGAAKDTLSPLLGNAPDPELVKNIEDTVLSHPEVVGIHDLMIHDYGPARRYVSLHAEVNGSGNIFHLHDAVDMAEQELRERFNVFATIHMDPIESENSLVSLLRHAVSEKLKEITPDIKVHDFRMVPGPTHTNLIFDAVVPADFKMEDEELAERIRSLVAETWKNHRAVVCIDREYAAH